MYIHIPILECVMQTNFGTRTSNLILKSDFKNASNKTISDVCRYHFLHLFVHLISKFKKDESTKMLKIRQNKSGTDNKKMLIPQKNKIP